MLAWMADALEPEDAEDRKPRERLAGRVGRQVEGVASVRPAIRDGWVSWLGMGVDASLERIVTAVVAFTATLSAQERRRARVTGFATRMAFAVTEHEAHLFRTRAMGRIIGDHVTAVPYGMVAKVTIGKTMSARTTASFVKVTIELTDGSRIKLDGDAEHRRVLEQLQARAAGVPVGTVARRRRSDRSPPSPACSRPRPGTSPRARSASAGKSGPRAAPRSSPRPGSAVR